MSLGRKMFIPRNGKYKAELGFFSTPVSSCILLKLSFFCRELGFLLEDSTI